MTATERRLGDDSKHTPLEWVKKATPEEFCALIDNNFSMQTRNGQGELDALKDAIASCGFLSLARNHRQDVEEVVEVVVSHLEINYREPFRNWIDDFERARKLGFPVMGGFQMLYDRATKEERSLRKARYLFTIVPVYLKNE